MIERPATRDGHATPFSPPVVALLVVAVFVLLALIDGPQWFGVLIVLGLPALLIWVYTRSESVQARADRGRAKLEAQRGLIERNYRMEVQLGWRPDHGYDLAAECTRFNEMGSLNGMPRPAIWSYSDALGGVPIRTPGGAVGPLNRRYGPWTPLQWAGVAAGAYTLLHHRR